MVGKWLCDLLYYKWENNLFGCSSDPGNRQVKVRLWGLPVSGQCTLIFEKHLCISVNQVTGTVVFLVVFFNLSFVLIYVFMSCKM